MAHNLPDPPELNIDPFAPDILADPYAYHEALREIGAVAKLRDYDAYIVGRYDEVITVSSDYNLFTSSAGMGLTDIRKPGAWRKASPLAEIDPPDHTAIRSVLNRIISPAVIRDWRADFKREAEAVVDTVLGKTEFDGVSDLAEEFVLTAFPKMFGVPLIKENAILIGEMNFNQLGPQNELLKKSLMRAEPILEWYEESFQRENITPGGMAEKIYLAEDEGLLAEGTGAPHVRGFVRGGTDTTIAGIGHTLYHLARNPDQWQILKEDPSKVRGAFEEAVRLESPVQVLFRTTTRDVEFGGYQLAGDTKIAMSFASANRDPRQWTRPDDFLVERQTAGIHVALGSGAHRCIGQMIARMEAEALLGAFVRRVKVLEMAGDVELRPVNTVRTLANLPLRVVAH